jgi:hypothetical protein
MNGMGKVFERKLWLYSASEADWLGNHVVGNSPVAAAAAAFSSDRSSKGGTVNGALKLLLLSAAAAKGLVTRAI